MAPGQCLSRGVGLWTSAEWRKPNTSKHPTSSHLFVVRSLLPWVLQTAEHEYEDSWCSVSRIPRRALFGWGGAGRGGAQLGSSGGSQGNERPSLVGVVGVSLEVTPLVTCVDRRMHHTSQQPQHRIAPRVVTLSSYVPSSLVSYRQQIKSTKILGVRSHGSPGGPSSEGEGPGAVVPSGGPQGGSQVDKRPSLLGVVVLLLEGTPLVTFVDRRMPHTPQQPQCSEL